MVSRFLKRLFLLAVVAASSLHIVKAQELYPYQPGTYGTYFNNYVSTIDLKSPQTDTTGSSFLPLRDALLTTQYYDGLGRPLQTIIRGGSLVTGGSAKDFVHASVYDPFGYETRKYLPYAAGSSGGGFQINPFDQQKDFYDVQFASQGEQFYYSKTEVNAPSSQIPMKSFAPGNSWVGGNRGVIYKYWFNRNKDSVRIWSVTDYAGEFGTYLIDTANSGYYPEGRLNKTAIIDEHGKQVIEFKDMQGKIILKKVQLTADADTGTGKGYYGWLSTYYIYDDLSQLRCVVQPKGVELLAANGWSMTYSSGIILKEQCFRYEYDNRQRMILKKIPGAGTVYMVYDARDRLVLMQDSLLRATGKWIYTLYDVFNRPKETGLWTSSDIRSYHAVRADTSVAYPNLGSQTIEELTRTFYDSYAWRNSEGNPLSSSRNTSTDSHFITPTDGTWPYPQSAISATSALTGLVTGTKTRVLGTNDFLFTVMFYDEKARGIQVQATNITGGTDIMSTQYAWSGQLLLSITKHEKAASNNQTTIMLTKFTYDDLGRMVKTEKRISNSKVNIGAMPGSWTTLSEHEYDALGQLKKKKLAPAYNSNAGLETMNYEYNIRGWMLGANRSYVKDTASTSNWFGFDLGYDKTAFTVNGSNQSYSAAQYNGNINGMLWRSTGDGQLRKYDFTYDAANRFLSADFNQYTNATFNKNAGIDFSVSGMSYDANGNILSMKQRGVKFSGSVTIDSLTYNYYTNSNRLLNVIDGVNEADTKLGDFRTSTLHPSSASKNSSTIDYTYDGNGNMIKDLNKDIVNYTGADGIEYNYLNLPKKITVKKDGSTNKGTIEYTYDAAGNKLKKTVYEPGVDTTVTLYLMANYINDTLQFIATEEGRLRYKSTDDTLYYDYFLQDHLGNVRTVLTDELRTDMYPAATMELAAAESEETFYGSLESSRDVPGAPYFTSWFPENDWGEYAARIDRNSTGPTLLLKVMAGDKFNLTAQSGWMYSMPYLPNSQDGGGIPWDLFSIMTEQLGGASNGKVSGTDLQLSELFGSQVNAFFDLQNDSAGSSGGTIHSFVNWILFDEQFNIDLASSGFSHVGNPNVIKTHVRADLPVRKNGYLFVFLSNTNSDVSVYFDGLQVSHERGPLVEENHYYPFGLTMAGISSKALNYGNPKNKHLYNGKELQSNEFNDGAGMECYDYGFRTQDHQIGRFWQIDPHVEKYSNVSPYSYVLNNPINMIDPDGRDAIFTAVYDKDGNLSGITISATVYIKGAGASANKARDLTKAANQLFNTRQFDGVSVSFDIRYKHSESIREDELKEGENILTFSAESDRARSHVKSILSTSEGANGERIVEVSSGRTGTVYGSGRQRSVMHETGHLLGLVDRYAEYTSGYMNQDIIEQVPGWSNDIMHNGNNVSDKHYQSFIKSVPATNYFEFLTGIKTPITGLRNIGPSLSTQLRRVNTTIIDITRSGRLLHNLNDPYEIDSRGKVTNYSRNDD